MLVKDGLAAAPNCVAPAVLHSARLQPPAQFACMHCQLRMPQTMAAEQVIQHCSAGPWCLKLVPVLEISRESLDFSRESINAVHVCAGKGQAGCTAGSR